jgi:hypothetical protein
MRTNPGQNLDHIGDIAASGIFTVESDPGGGGAGVEISIGR